MNIKEGKQQFIHEWGIIGSNWGINRTMAQVHALLLIAPKPMCTEKIMEELSISRGNANMNLRALMDWDLLHKKIVPGERRVFFFAEKDLWVVVRQVIRHRKKKELDPILKLMEDCCHVEGDCTEAKEFCRMMGEIRSFSNQVENSLDMIVNADNNWFVRTLLNRTK